MKPVINVCVTCVGGRLTYDSVRALRAAEDFDVFLIGIDADPTAAGRLLCDHFSVAPMAEEDEDGYIDHLLALHERFGINALIALSEGECRIVSDHRDSLQAKGINCSVSSAEVVRTMTDKLLMLQCLQDQDIDPGPFRAVDSEAEAEAAIAELGYPDRRVVLKPRAASGSRGVLIADASMSGFQRLLPERFCGAGPYQSLIGAMADEGMGFENLIAVPYYEGPVFDVDCIAVNGELVDVAARLRQLKNPLWPTSTGHKISMDPRVLELAKKLCRAFGVHGAGDFDIVLENGETPRLFDSGARFSGSVGGSFTAGANFPAQLVRVLVGLPRQDETIEDGVVLRPYITMARIPAANEDDLL
jgi:carbamoyl-phosphate synthase large subunit